MNNIDEKAKDVVKNIADIQGGVVGENPGGEESPTPEEPEKPDVPELQEGWVGENVYAVYSGDTERKIVPVPKGFVISGIESEKSVSTGLVIYEVPEGEREGINWTEDANDNNYPDVQEKYNQFVWVPVAEPSEMFGTDKDGNYLGKLYTFSKSGDKTVVTAYNWKETEEIGKKVMSWSSNTGYREPDIVKDYDGTDSSNSSYFKVAISSTMTKAQFKTQLQIEFKDMKASVEKYNGFYIGRYETGNLSQNKAVVSKGNTDIANKNWYVQYQKSKTVVEEKSSMIWGCQWDAVMKWFLSSGDEETRNYVTNGTGKGNHSGTQEGGNKAIPTGSNDNYSVNNIYDMAGNVYDWTIEAYDTYGRLLRRWLLRQ